MNHVIELGCGSAIPSLLLFQYALKNQLSMYFTLTDYNISVLRLVTLPNLILSWCASLSPEESSKLFNTENGGNPLLDPEAEHADVYLTPELISAFKAALTATGITLTLISGSWKPLPTLLSLVPSAPELNTFIMGSETIYSPASLAAFTEAITELMKRVKSGKTLVAAKRVYFGVGGSVDGFREECSRQGCVAYEVEFEGLDTNGVRRCLVEVQMY